MQLFVGPPAAISSITDPKKKHLESERERAVTHSRSGS